MLSGAVMTYAQSSTYTSGISVRADILYDSYSDTSRQYKTGEEVAHCIIVSPSKARLKEPPPWLIPATSNRTLFNAATSKFP
jgi:hypothetical protein